MAKVRARGRRIHSVKFTMCGVDEESAEGIPSVAAEIIATQEEDQLFGGLGRSKGPKTPNRPEKPNTQR